MYSDRVALHKSEHGTYQAVRMPHKRYMSVKNFVLNGRYDKVINQFMSPEVLYPCLEKLLLARLKDEDLPLFISFEWRGIESLEIFFRRLKGTDFVTS